MSRTGSLTGSLLASRYRLRESLGQGGAAQAYLADDLVERTQVALKLLDAKLSPELLQREFERMRDIVHPHLTRVHELATVRIEGQRRAFYTAELVPGGDLRAYVAEVGFERARTACCDVLDALHWLHRLGLRHGDVKPDNVLVDGSGRAVLIDLGCAAPLGQISATLSGTPGYMAPELREGRLADERADLFAFGVLLRELGAPEPALIAALTAEAVIDRPSSAREVLTQLGDQRDVESSTRGRAARCVGRDGELDDALRTLVDAGRGEPGPRCVWVEGPAGIGRSRFLRELCFRLGRAELSILEASPRDAEPVRSALERHAAPFAAGFEALLEQLEDLAGEPLVLVLDDAHELAQDARLELGFVLRALPARGRLCALVASSEPPPSLARETCLHMVLPALSESAVASWVAGALEPSRVHELWRATGGYPRYVERTLAALVEGRLRAAALSQTTTELDADSARALAASLAGLSADEQRALGEIALTESTSRDRAVLDKLLTRGLITRRGERLSLLRTADRPQILASLPAQLLCSLRLEAARALATRGDADALARAIECFALAGKPQEARALLDRVEPLARAAPRVFAQRLLGCVEQLRVPQRVLVASLLRLSGEATRALSVLARVRRVSASTTSVALWMEAAEVYLALGRPRRAERCLARCSAADDPAWSELSARVLVRLGAYQRAADNAREALSRQPAPLARARLLEALSLAEAYLGELEQARAHVSEALTLHAESEVRARARCSSLRGFIALRAGQTAEAVTAYGEALALAEPHGLVDLVLNALANLGNARQSLGQWGRALETYERALRLAGALGRAASVRSLRGNLANLSLELGHFERARRELDALAEPGQERVDSAALATSLVLYRAELLLLTAQPRDALSLLDSLLTSSSTPRRERVEARIHQLAAHLLLGPQTSPSLEPLRAELQRELVDVPDELRARATMLEARALLASGQARVGVERLEAALERVRGGDDQALLAGLEGTLSELCKSLAASSMASEYEARARARWERIALDLPPSLRELFWAHPGRALFTREGSRVSTGKGRATLSLSRVRELNRRIGALRDRDEVLAFALDAAIELTGAERGFVLLSEPGSSSFQVAAAQHMEGARMRKSEWKWSRSIAERVIRQGEPVLTVDAGSDPRFARQASVHAMQLKSVLCAPIRGKSAIVGALYLDNRLSRARFAPEDAELLLTFADQVAIALSHAALVLALETKARELLREKRKVEQLARGQASEIERLSEELTVHRSTLATRYDYRDIVGRSEPMRRVLAVLDRVTETDLSVLVLGESGTGKELVARALHMNGPRQHKPFVGINCAALPEALLESELFGHVKGAFTGASSAREGLFVSARGGTLFLDELGDLPLSMQAKLLRVLNDGEVRAVGATRSQSVDVRLVCATNKNLKQCVAEGSFRDDLYYRVGVVELSLPPLRERSDDIVPIAEKILRARAEQTGQPVSKLSPDAIRALLSYPWPGNVRELQNVLLRASVMAESGLIRSTDLALGEPSAPPRVSAKSRSEYVQKEAERLLSALETERWNVSRVAKNLGIPRNTLYRKLARYGIQREP